jgi:hypothetical protein
MYSIFQYTQRLSPEPKSMTSHTKISETLSKKSKKRVQDWKTENKGLMKEIFGTVRYKNSISDAKKQHQKGPQKSLDYEKNPYFVSDISDILRKTEKSKHLGNQFIRVKYMTEKERISNSVCKNLSLDTTPNQSPVPDYKKPISYRTVDKKSVPETSYFTSTDPFSESSFEKLFRIRQKSLERGKNFFVTRVATPKPSLLITKKFDDLYSQIRGNNRKIYKNSVDELFYAKKEIFK